MPNSLILKCAEINIKDAININFDIVIGRSIADVTLDRENILIMKLIYTIRTAIGTKIDSVDASNTANNVSNAY
jgi:hypothetical protein